MAKKKAAQWLNTRLIILRIEGSNPAAEKPGKRKWGLKGRSRLAELVPPVKIFILNFIQKIGTKIN